MNYIPDGTDEKKALSRTTHLAISAHQDDIEFMASRSVSGIKTSGSAPLL